MRNRTLLRHNGNLLFAASARYSFCNSASPGIKYIFQLRIVIVKGRVCEIPTKCLVFVCKILVELKFGVLKLIKKNEEKYDFNEFFVFICIIVSEKVKR